MFWRFIQIKSEAGDTSWLQADGLLGNYLERGLLCYEFVQLLRLLTTGCHKVEDITNFQSRKNSRTSNVTKSRKTEQS